MIQFNQQYIRDYLKPFLRDVLTDMAASEEPGGKDYLRKIINQEDLGDVDKQQFNQDYFLGTQPPNRPFISEEEEPYRQEFLRTLATHIDMLVKLSNKEGMRQAILPDAAEGRLFGTNQSLTINLNGLSIKMARKFEKSTIEKQLKEEGKATQENLKKLEDGELKLVEMDEEVQVKSEEELEEMARKEPEKLVVPMIEPDLEKEVMALPLEDAGNPEPEKPEPIAKSVKEVHKDMENGKIAAIRELLTSSGLEVVGELTMENGKIHGTVRDVSLQELEVTIDTKKPDYAPDKFIFVFTEVGPNGDMKGKEIPVSREDIPNLFFDEDGKRRSAENVFKEHDARGQMAREKFNPPQLGQTPIKMPEKKPQGPPVPMEEGIAIPKQSVAVPQGQQAQPGGTVIQKTSTPIPGVISVAPKTTKARIQTKKQLQETVKESRIRGPEVAGPKTVQQKKKRLKEQKQASADAQQQGQRRRPIAEEAKGRPQSQKRSGNWLAKAAVVVGSSGMGGIFYALFHTATS
ncbi:MAG: hypothetical protein R3B71_00535 [Candidatus Gracilibacteria bacterium]